MHIPGTRVRDQRTGRTGTVMTQPELSDSGAFSFAVDVLWDGDAGRSVADPRTLRAAEVRGLKTGDLVTIGGRAAVVETVAPDGQSFTDTRGASHPAALAELVPLAS